MVLCLHIASDECVDGKSPNVAGYDVKSGGSQISAPRRWSSTTINGRSIIVTAYQTRYLVEHASLKSLPGGIHLIYTKMRPAMRTIQNSEKWMDMLSASALLRRGRRMRRFAYISVC
jgi:hypothetical protein